MEPFMPLIRLARKIVDTGVVGAVKEGAQYGAIPFRVVEGHVVFLMITSRRSANWVFPKGSVDPGQSPRDTVAREAFEEAGIRGEIGKKPVGFYLHPRNNEDARLVRIQLFPMEVTEQLDIWPEEAERFRHWALLPQVRRLMASRQAARVAADLNRRILNGDYMPGSRRAKA
jgi:8-oxo-dGTP pyrophosphatase MutT (NUDIX family)